MSKSKKSSKNAKIPQPIKIKKEKLEEDRTLHSMAHFVDDRIELVKQIFGSLKTKTITNLAPEYLKEKDMDDIQELCLNELLCLSKKRLLSIINATKCPTDTESSEDSDVEAKEEHISLEEISSESELENGDKSSIKRSALQTRTKKHPKKANQSTAADKKNGNDGQMSVLELLELQARARAIRSQLALEPVTKIEVDLDDDDTTPNANVSSTTKEQKTNRKRKKSTNKDGQKLSSTSTKQSTNMPVSAPTPAPAPEIEASSSSSSIQNSSRVVSSQKIKLKRNFRKQNQDILEADSSEQKQPNSEKIKKEKVLDRSRSPSPDVIPIVPEPETLCISDSDTEAEKEKNKTKEEKLQEAKPVPTPPQPPVMEKSMVIEEKKEEEEAEDGEIIETEDTNSRENIENHSYPDTNAKESSQMESVKETNTENNDEQRDKIIILEDKVLNNFAETTECNRKPSDDHYEPENSNRENSIYNREHDMDGDHNDDVISLEGGDLETEMSEHLEDDRSSKKDFNQKKDESNDIISLESSENEDESMNSDNTDSWHARYLKSTKVNKVLAVSRLGKRVRDKLKTSKLSKREISDENFKQEVDNFKSKHEEGSVQQYKEILELSHRKS